MRPDAFDPALSTKLDRFTAPLPDPVETAALIERLRPLAAARQTSQARFRETGLHRHPLYAMLDWLLVQTHLFHPGFWVASALLLVVGLVAGITVSRAPGGLALALMAPLPALLGVAYAFRASSGAHMEMELSSPVSPVQVVLGRTLVVLGYNLLLGGVVVAVLPGIGEGMGPLLLGWLAPLLFLTGLTLFLTTWLGTYAGVGAGFAVWGAQVILRLRAAWLLQTYPYLTLYGDATDARWWWTQMAALGLGLVLLVASQMGGRRLAAGRG